MRATLLKNRVFYAVFGSRLKIKQILIHYFRYELPLNSLFNGHTFTGIKKMVFYNI